MSTHVDVEDFRDRYATCPLCQRDNVRLAPWMGIISFDEHPIPLVVVAHPAPIDPSARFNPRASEARYAHARCPLSRAPLIAISEDQL